jgi:O-antigen ligase
MTRYQFRVHSANVLFAILVFAVMAFGAVERWALTVVEVSILLLALVWVLRRAFRPFPLEGNLFAWPVLAVALMAVSQGLAGWSVAVYQTAGEALKWTALLLYFLMWANVFRDQSTRKRFSSLLTWFGFLLAVLALVQFYSSPDLLYWFRPAPTAQPFGPFVDRNHYAVLMELVLPGALLFAFRKSEKQLLYFVLCGLMLASVVVCASRAGAVIVASELIVVAVVTLATGRRFRESGRELAKVAALIILALGLTFAAGTRRLLDRFEPLDKDMNRAEVALATWELARTRPWTGYGLGTFQLVFPSFAPFDDGHRWNHAHNDPLQFGMEMGITGFACQIALIGLLLSRRYSKEVWLGNVLPLVGVWAHSLVEFPLQIPGLLIVALAVLAHIPKRSGHQPVLNRHGRSGASEDLPSNEAIAS